MPFTGNNRLEFAQRAIVPERLEHPRCLSEVALIEPLSDLSAAGLLVILMIFVA